MSTLSLYHARHVARLAEGVRPVRVMHALDGIEQEVPPEMLVEAGQALWERWREHLRFRPHDLILGLDAGGILPTIALALASRTPYRLSWRLDLDYPNKHVFQEPHSLSPELFVYGRFQGRRILIADDEVTTGRTAASLAGVLQKAGADVVGVACLVEDTSGNGRSFLTEIDIPLCALTTL
ncbi:MAG: phosphoribosyltransferase [Egibacteraceae bacterium]